MAKKAAKKVTKTATKVAKAKKAPTAKTVAKKTATKKPAKKKPAKKKPAKKKATETELIKKHVAKLIKKNKPTERDEATKAAKAQLYDALHAVIRETPLRSDAKKIIEEEVRDIRRMLLEEVYRDNPEDLANDSGWDIAINDEDDVENQAADFVSGLDDEDVDERLEGYI